MERLGKLIHKHHIYISVQISKRLDARYNEFLHSSNLEDDTIVKWRAQLIQYIGESLVEGHTNPVWDHVTDWASQTAAGAVQYNIGVDELFQTVRVYREVIWDFIEENIHEEATFKTFTEVNKIIDSILDQVAFVCSTSYVKYYSKSLSLIKESMVDISTPIVSISSRTAILPLIGEIDTYRAKVLMEKTLNKCVELKKSELIIDLSGVPIVDTMVAHELFKVADALMLIGVSTIFTGIRSEIAQSIVQLGVDFSKVKIMGSLEQALKANIK